MSDDRERQMIENAKRAEKAAAPKAMDKPADSPVAAEDEVTLSDASRNQEGKD